MITALFDHLWQSTAFVCAAGLLTLTLRRQAARTRYWVWLVASLKFLVPFSLLTAVGRRLAPQQKAPVAFSSFAGLATHFATPFVETRGLESGTRGGLDVTSLVLGLWVSGTIIVALVWVIRWLRLRAVVWAAQPLDLEAPVPVKSTAERIEPSLVGIWRPVLLLPEEAAQRLSHEELRSIIAHEVCHLRRRDNLTAAMHLVVEAVFWFYPLT